MWAAVVYLPFTMKYFLMICVLVVPFSDCGTVNISGHPTPLKPDTQVPATSKLTNTHHHTEKSTKQDHHHNHHNDGKVNTHHHNDGKVNTHHHNDGKLNTHHHNDAKLNTHHHNDAKLNTHHHNDAKLNTHHHNDAKLNTHQHNDGKSNHHHTSSKSSKIDHHHNHHQASKSSKSSKIDHHHNHHQASKSSKSDHRHPSPVKVSKLDHRPKVSKLSKSRNPIVAVFPPKSSAVWARQKAAYSHPSHNVVYSGKPAHHVPYSAQAKKSSSRPRYPLRAPLPRAAPRPIPLRRKHINPLQRLFGQHERSQRHPTRLIQGPPAKLRHPQRVPVPNFVYLPAEQLPGYETFKLHEVIRKQEGTQIFDGRKPDVIHYVDSPEIQTTVKPEEEKEEYKEKVVVKKEIKKEDKISELIDERSAKKPKEFQLR